MGVAFKAEEGMSATSVSAGSMWHSKALGRRNEKAVLEKGGQPGGGIQMYTYRKGKRTTGSLTRATLEVLVHVENHFVLFG